MSTTATMHEVFCGIHVQKMEPCLTNLGYICRKCQEDIEVGEMSFKNLQDSMALVYKLNAELNSYKNTSRSGEAKND